MYHLGIIRATTTIFLCHLKQNSVIHLKCHKFSLDQFPTIYTNTPKTRQATTGCTIPSTTRKTLRYSPFKWRKQIDKPSTKHQMQWQQKAERSLAKQLQSSDLEGNTILALGVAIFDGELKQTIAMAATAAAIFWTLRYPSFFMIY